MPQVLAEVIEACLNSRPHQELADAVLKDAVFAARVILAAHKTGDRGLAAEEPVSSAVRALGSPMLVSIALQAASEVASRQWSDRQLAFQYRLWESSQIGAVAAQCLAPSVNYPAVEEAQLCGLLLNLGIHLLASRHGEAYVGEDVSAWGAEGQCSVERQLYGTDHLRVADQLISQWPLDSFLGDAIRFLDADPTQIEQSGPLLKIARLAREFCADPVTPSEPLEQLAESLFGLRKSEIDYLFSWAGGLFPKLPDPDRTDALREDLEGARQRLTDLIVMLADQEALRARLYATRTPEALSRVGRALYLENTPATDVVFFMLDRHDGRLTGVASGPQQRMAAQLSFPQGAADGLLLATLEGLAISDSVKVQQPLSVTDQLLLRLCRGHQVSCHPLLDGDRLFGIAVLGCAVEEDLPLLDTLRIRMIDQLLGGRLAQISAEPVQGEAGGEVLRRVNHEVNGPLTVIANYAEVLRHIVDGQDHQQLTTSIKAESRRIHDIIHYYLNQQELPGFVGEAVDLNQLAEEVCAGLSDSELSAGTIAIRKNFSRGLDKLTTNPVLVRQVLVNLLKNAAEALSEGGTITLATRDSYLADGGRHAELIVEDSGPGIAPQIRGQLFQPVVSTKGPGHGGVGLSIVKQMVDDLGGRISCSSQPEGGTSFCVQLPYASSAARNSRRSS